MEFDDNLGALDSDGEIGHLHKGIDNVVHLPELVDISETTLPLFEKSLIDPESPALNEDGEFPEYDLNLVYSTADVACVKLYDIRNRYLAANSAKIKDQYTNNKPHTAHKTRDIGVSNIFSKWDYALSRLTNTKIVLSGDSKISDLYSIDRDISSIAWAFNQRKLNFSFGSAITNINSIHNDYDIKKS